MTVDVPSVVVPPDPRLSSVTLTGTGVCGAPYIGPGEIAAAASEDMAAMDDVGLQPFEYHAGQTACSTAKGGTPRPVLSTFVRAILIFRNSEKPVTLIRLGNWVPYKNTFSEKTYVVIFTLTAPHLLTLRIKCSNFHVPLE